MTEASEPRPRRRARTQRHKDTPLSQKDWVTAAMEILVKDSVRGIRIDALCTRLGVTKGSFYWHFKGRAQLLVAVLEGWRMRATANVIARLDDAGSSPAARLGALFRLPRQRNSARAARIEQSIRDWARSDTATQKAVREVDEERLEYLQTQFESLGLEPRQAHLRAYMAYCLMMGDSVLQQSLGGQISQADLADAALEVLTKVSPS